MGPNQQSPCIPFYPYTMFQNPMAKLSCQKSRKTIITQNVLVIQSSNIVHCNWHTQKSISPNFQAFSNNFSLFKLMFFFSSFVMGSSANSQNFHILLISNGKNALKWLEWHIFRISSVPNLMAQVSSLYDKWFLKNDNFRQKFHFLWILTGKMHQNGLSGMYLGFNACQIQWCKSQVSLICGS